MTGREAIPKIMALITQLIEQAKDSPSLALIQQIQQYQLVIHRDLMESYAKIAKLESEQPRAITEIQESHRLETAGLISQLARLKGQFVARQKDGVSPDTITILKIFFNSKNSMSRSEERRV